MRPLGLIVSLLPLALFAGGLPLTGCVYRMAVQQGNYLDDKQITQLQSGMTRAQVRFLLGTPVLPDAFNADRWDYVYYLKAGRLKKAEQRRLTVFFADEKVARFEKAGFPEPAAPTPGAAPASVPSPVAPPAVAAGSTLN